MTDEGKTLEGKTLEERITHCRETIRAGKELPGWVPTQWVNAITYRLGQAAYNAQGFEEAILAVFPGSAAESLEALVADLTVIIAVSMDAIEALESGAAEKGGAQ